MCAAGPDLQVGPATRFMESARGSNTAHLRKGRAREDARPTLPGFMRWPLER